MFTIILYTPSDDLNLVFQFLDRKRQEGKHYLMHQLSLLVLRSPELMACFAMSVFVELSLLNFLLECFLTGSIG